MNKKAAGLLVILGLTATLAACGGAETPSTAPTGDAMSPGMSPGMSPEASPTVTPTTSP